MRSEIWAGNDQNAGKLAGNSPHLSSAAFHRSSASTKFSGGLIALEDHLIFAGVFPGDISLISSMPPEAPRSPSLNPFLRLPRCSILSCSALSCLSLSACTRCHHVNKHQALGTKRFDANSTKSTGRRVPTLSNAQETTQNTKRKKNAKPRSQKIDPPHHLLLDQAPLSSLVVCNHLVLVLLCRRGRRHGSGSPAKAVWGLGVRDSARKRCVCQGNPGQRIGVQTARRLANHETPSSKP